MATIRAYTSLEQSRKLAEILPLESADNVIVSFGSRDGVKTVVMPKETFDVIRTPFADIRETTMCWSLAALLNVLPEIQGGKPIIALDDNYITYPHMSDLHTKADNLVNACMAMIEHLHELKML